MTSLKRKSRDRMSVAIVETNSRPVHPPVLKRSWSLQDYHTSWHVDPPPCMSNRAHYVLMTAKRESLQPEKSLAPELSSKKSPAQPPPRSHASSPLVENGPQRPLPPTPVKPIVGSVGLNSSPWYHSLDRRTAEQQLHKIGEDGCFIVRPSARSSNPCTLMLLYHGRIYNIGIRQRADGYYSLGTEKHNEQKFASVEALVHNYRNESLVLYSNSEKTGRTLLTATIERGSNS